MGVAVRGWPVHGVPVCQSVEWGNLMSMDPDAVVPSPSVGGLGYYRDQSEDDGQQHSRRERPAR